jgi:hypothetical protein
MATRGEIPKLFSVLGTAYPRYALSGAKLAPAVEVWHEPLGDLDFGLLEAAACQHCTTSQWFPSLAEIRTAALDLMEPAGLFKSAGEAWEEVRLALSRGEHGYRKGHYAWSSELVERAFRGIGGWHCFSQALMDSVATDRAHFIRAYNELVEREERAQRESPVIRAYRQAVLGDGATEDRSKRPRMIAVDVEEERRLLAGGQTSEVEKKTSEVVEGLARRWRMPAEDS